MLLPCPIHASRKPKTTFKLVCAGTEEKVRRLLPSSPFFLSLVPSPFLGPSLFLVWGRWRRYHGGAFCPYRLWDSILLAWVPTRCCRYAFLPAFLHPVHSFAFPGASRPSSSSGAVIRVGSCVCAASGVVAPPPHGSPGFRVWVPFFCAATAASPCPRCHAPRVSNLRPPCGRVQ